LRERNVLRLLNRYEEVAHSEIKVSAERWGLSVYPKVRLADVVPLGDLGIAEEDRSYGFKAHFDFVVCRNGWDPEYAIEFDGCYHSTTVQMERDRKKNHLCAKCGLPLLRINSKYLSPTYGTLSLLAWLMDVYELKLGFEEQQACGAIPDDEPFDPFFFTSPEPGNIDRFPYWFAARPRIRLRRLCERGTILDPASSSLIGYDEKNVMRGMEYIRLTSSSGLYVRTAMRPQSFPLCFSDLLDEILSVQLAERVFGWLRREVREVPLRTIYSVADKMRANLAIARSRIYGRSEGSRRP
jgi:hypothetical protein